MLRVITVNVNGIRAAARKGFFDWLRHQRADVVCLQETKAQEHQLDGGYYPKTFHAYYFDAEKKGYSGTALFARKEPRRIVRGLGWDPVDSEGRWLQADYADLSIVSFYLPSGSASPERHQRKLQFMERMFEEFRRLRRQRREFIICGDFNIVHREIDITNWKSNQKNSGCTPEERAWLDRLFDELGYVDAFRVVDPRPGQYTWWSNRGRAREKNVGWRIDYQIVSPGLKDRIRKARIYKDKWFSDHAPLIMDYDIEL